MSGSRLLEPGQDDYIVYVSVCEGGGGEIFSLKSPSLIILPFIYYWAPTKNIIFCNHQLTEMGLWLNVIFVQTQNRGI